MHLAHEFTVPAGPEETWSLLTDLHRVGSCFPGATVTDASAEEFSGTVKVKLGPIAMLYAGSGRFVQRDDAAHTAVIEAQGKDKRGNGTAGATVNLRLVPDGTGTRAEVGTELTITGKPAQFGRGVMQDVSDKLLAQFIGCIEGQLAQGPGGDEEPGPIEPAPADSVPTEPVPTEPVPTEPGTTEPAPTEPASTEPATTDEDVIDLGSTVLPVLARRYGGYLAAALAGLVVGVLLGRRVRT